MKTGKLLLTKGNWDDNKPLQIKNTKGDVIEPKKNIYKKKVKLLDDWSLGHESQLHKT